MSTLTDRLYALHDRLRTLSHDLQESGDALKAGPSEKRAAEAQACLNAIYEWRKREERAKRADHDRLQKAHD